MSCQRMGWGRIGSKVELSQGDNMIDGPDPSALGRCLEQWAPWLRSAHAAAGEDWVGDSSA